MRRTISEERAIINNFMEKLQITEQEAIELLAYDDSLKDSDVKGVQSSTNKAADLLTTQYRNSGIKIYEREVKPDSEIKKTRPRKPDATKAEITSTCADALEHIATCKLTHVPEKTIDFVYNGHSYNLKLTKHNTYKGIAAPKSEKRKVNEEKAFIISTLAEALNNASFTVTQLLVQTETKINFNVAETNYTIALTAHR